MLQRSRIEAHESAYGRGRSERAGVGGSKKSKTCLSTDPNVAGDIDSERDCNGEIAPSDAAATLGVCERGREDTGHRVDHRSFVQAIEFGIVELVGIT